MNMLWRGILGCFVSLSIVGCDQLQPIQVLPCANDACDTEDEEDDDDLSSTVCGDAVLDSTEECDDGNNIDDDGCSARCYIEYAFDFAVCGDGVREGDEVCDDGNTTGGDGCSVRCLPEVIPRDDLVDSLGVCGNGIVEQHQEYWEDCDDGNTISGDGCDANCYWEAYCGDGTVQPGERCDDGNETDGDGCDNCQTVCGDGVLSEPWEQCERGMELPVGQCVNCRIVASCGDGVVQGGEDCEIGDPGCDDRCRAICGDGMVVGHEQCDPGPESDPYCSAQCRIQAVCGDGTVGRGELCEPDVHGSGCDENTCRPVCGDGVVLYPWETCEPGHPDNDPQRGECSAVTCRYYTVCGNGVVENGEDCDPNDPNHDPSSGVCTDQCRLTSICGNGVREPGEQCDGTAGCTEECSVIPQ